MPEGRDAKPEKPDAEESTWLEKYYTSSKTSSESEGMLPEGAPGPSELLTPNVSEKYDVTGEVGVGGMKVVRRAHDRNADRDVALAMVRKAAPHSAQERRFLREARITAALEHPNIVPVHEIGLDTEHRPYFTMKLLGGENLHDILRHLDDEDRAYLKQFPLGRLLEIFQNVCQAVAFAHSRGVVHLDLKPANIQVGSFGEVLVLDWGLAKLLDHRTGAAVELPAALREVPVEGAVRGTPGYMAPEQQQGNFAALDERTDIYALGAVLQSMAHGKRNGNPPRKVPPALEAVIAKAMAVEPRDRYRSVLDLSRDVRNFLGGFAVSAQTVGLGTLFWLLVKRHKAVSTVIAASLVTITVLLTVFFVKITKSERRARHALKLYEDEQSEKFRIGKFAIPQLIAHADALQRIGSNQEAMAELALVVTIDPGMADAWARKGMMHMGLGEFDEAMRSFNRAPGFAKPAKPGKIPYAGEIADKYRKLSRLTGSLNYDQWMQFILDVTRPGNGIPPVFQENTLRLLFERINENNLLDSAHLDFIGNCLCLMNPKAVNAVYQYQMRTSGLTMEIHGEQLAQLLPLTGLRMYSLNLAGTAVGDLTPLHEAGLQMLDLSGTPVRELTPLFDQPITELRLAYCPNIKVEQLRYFPKLERVTISQKLLTTPDKLLFQTETPPTVIWE